MSKDTYKFDKFTPGDVWERVIGAHMRLGVLGRLFDDSAEGTDDPAFFIGLKHIVSDIQQPLAEIFGDIERIWERKPSTEDAEDREARSKVELHARLKILQDGIDEILQEEKEEATEEVSADE